MMMPTLALWMLLSAWHPVVNNFHGKCPVCEVTGTKSKVSVGFQLCTAVYCGSSYYDEDGREVHPQACNTCTAEARCSLGHTFTVTDASL